MCGIFGYVSTRDKRPASQRGEQETRDKKFKNAARVVFEGLKTLEYRGYDSWGIVADKNPLTLEKYVGKLPNSSPLIAQIKTTAALGHTRWATHGGVTAENAHPHVDCHAEIAVVHNGIIENWRELKKELLTKHEFKSETDTEVVVHLVEDLARKMPFEEAVRQAFLQVKGLNAFIFLKKGAQMVAVKSGSPLVLGIGKNETLIASDSAGLAPHTSSVVFLKDGEIVTIEKGKVVVSSAETGKAKSFKISRLNYEAVKSEKGRFAHFMLKEIYEQPEVIRNLSNNVEQARKIADLVNKCFGTFFVACGSASYAALSGTYLFSRLAKKHVNFSIGSEFKYLEDFIHKNTLMIAISQSGESVDVIEPVVRAKKKGAKIASIVNVVGSTLYRETDFNFVLGAWPEKAVVATKSLTAMIAGLILIVYSLGGQEKQGQKLLIEVAGDVKKILESLYIKKIKDLARLLKAEKDVYIIGRGLSYATALEAALKLKEACYVHAEGFAGGELKHGVIALIEKGTPCIVFAPNDETYVDVISNAEEVRARGGYIIGIGSKNNQVFDNFIETGDLKEGTMISQIVISQLLAYYLAIEKGLDPDKPRNLAKSVTVK